MRCCVAQNCSMTENDRLVQLFVRGYRMTIAARIVALIFLAVAGLIGLGGFSLWQMSSINAGVRDTNDTVIPGILKLQEAQNAFTMARPFLLNMLIVSGQAERENLVQRFNEGVARMNAAFADYERLVASDKDRELLARDRQAAVSALAVELHVVVNAAADGRIGDGTCAQQTVDPAGIALAEYQRRILAAGGGADAAVDHAARQGEAVDAGAVNTEVVGGGAGDAHPRE